MRAARDQRTDGGEGVYWTPVHKDCGTLSKRLGAAPRMAQERNEAGGAESVRVQHVLAVHSLPLVLPRDEIDMDDVDSKAKDHRRGLGFGLRDERKKAGSAAAPYVAFPAEQKASES